MGRPAVDDEEVTMRGQHPLRLWWGAIIITAALMTGCSSSSSKSDPSADDPIRKTNRSYLLRIGYEKGQANCVSRKVSVDLEKLLSASDSSDKPTEKAGFKQFATATRTCIEQDTGLTTTTAPSG